MAEWNLFVMENNIATRRKHTKIQVIRLHTNTQTHTHILGTYCVLNEQKLLLVLFRLFGFHQHVHLVLANPYSVTTLVYFYSTCQLPSFCFIAVRIYFVVLGWSAVTRRWPTTTTTKTMEWFAVRSTIHTHGTASDHVA